MQRSDRIHRISVTVTESGLQYNANDGQGHQFLPIWVPVTRDCWDMEIVASWGLFGGLERVAQALITVTTDLMQRLRQGYFSGMRSLTFDVGSSWVDCHVMLSTFDEVVLQYPMVAVGEQLPVIPVIQAGQKDCLSDAVLNTFNDVVGTRFALLVQQMRSSCVSASYSYSYSYSYSCLLLGALLA
ncbi:MAG: hypothetical protein P8144_13300 [Gammaproteobacteria bacterium]